MRFYFMHPFNRHKSIRVMEKESITYHINNEFKTYQLILKNRIIFSKKN
jgi:isocitrate dehydrogenase